jgi:hypothetical protein
VRASNILAANVSVLGFRKDSCWRHDGLSFVNFAHPLGAFRPVAGHADVVLRKEATVLAGELDCITPGCLELQVLADGPSGTAEWTICRRAMSSLSRIAIPTYVRAQGF